MWKLDNKIRTCLLALCGTYLYRNLIPESSSPLPYFRAFTIDLITGLSDEAPAAGLPGEEPRSTAQHTAVAQRIRCVNTGGLEEGMALQETVTQTDSTKMATPVSSTGTEQVHRTFA